VVSPIWIMLEAGYPHLSRAVSTSVPDGFLPSSGGFHLGECQVAAGLLNGQPIGGAQVDAGLATAGRMGDDGGILWYPGRMGLLVFKGFVHHCLGFSSPRTVMISIAGGSNIIRSNEADEYCGSKSNRRGHRGFVLSSTEQVPPGLFRWQGMALGSLLLPTIRNSTVSSMSFQNLWQNDGEQNCLNFEFFHLCLDSLIYLSWSKYTR